MDYQHLFRLLIVLFIGVTGLFYFLVYRHDELPTPSQVGTFQEHFATLLQQHVEPQYHSTIESMNEYKIY